MNASGKSGLTRYGILPLVVPILLTGCASEGPLRPPTLRLPAVVRALSAQRSGPGVDLAWTNPTRTTDGVSLTGKHGAGKLAAEICRAESFAANGNCSPIAKIPVEAGTHTSFRDALPTDLMAGPDRALRYRVRVLNGMGKGAAYAEILTAAGEAPAAMRGLTASPVAAGVALRWQPGATAQDRTLLHVTRGDAPVVAFRNSATPTTLPPDVAKPSETKPPATTLMAVEPGPHDPGGAVDTGGRAGVTQTYTVYRSRPAHIGGLDLAINGESASVTVAASALAPPPAPPTGLEAVANTLGSPSIDLVWQANTEPGVGGYLVFRADAAGTPTQLTASPVRGFSYTDATAQPGTDYRYSVAAVSTDGRAGEHSREIHASIPQP
ncbi:fibronectin type III domain-containing protein [Terriglobus roseus]|uniref:Fibronectin type-III domain-containing protein n=1 Tax=Terriglobus roseus TaxID=392734 RepID=A0A1H4P5H4_9BACT|nr:fibronectin type III domain-containing protein [Terriglobus roseus]SEC02731.1 hypothetical protein SAMN05443244_2460 [Terriglobus roseus]